MPIGQICLSAINNYAAALNLFNSRKPYRGRPLDPRPIGQRSRRNETIWQDANGDIHIRHWTTDIMTFHTDERVTLRPYSSLTTQKFVDRYAPQGIQPAFRTRIGSIIWIDSHDAHNMVAQASADPRLVGEERTETIAALEADTTRGYLVPHAITLIPYGPATISAQNTFARASRGRWAWPRLTLGDGRTWSIAPSGNQPEPIRTYDIDTQIAAKAFKESGYRGFAKWFHVYSAMEPEAAMTGLTNWGRRIDPPHLTSWPRYRIMDALREGGDAWLGLVDHYRQHSLLAVRHALHHDYACVRERKIGYLTEHSQINAVAQQRNRYAAMYRDQTGAWGAL
jgi:hypothetical protein